MQFSTQGEVLEMQTLNLTRRSILNTALSVVGVSAVSGFTSLIPSAGRAEILESVNWAGISYISGPHADLIHSRNALKIKVSGNSNQSKANKALWNALSSVNWKEVGLPNFDMEGYATTQFGMIFALATEMIIKLDAQEDYTDVVLRLVGYNILFDVETRNVISTFPVRGKYLQSYEGLRTVNLTELFLGMITGSNNTGDSIAAWYEKNLSSHSFEARNRGWSFQVAPLTYRDRVIEDCAAIGTTVEIFQDMVGLAATAAFGDATKAPVIPFRISRATSRDMLIVFSDSKRMGLALPSPNYAIEVKLRGWHFAEEQVTQHRKQVGLAVGMNIRIYDTDFKKEIFNQRYRGIHKYIEMSNRDSASSRLSRVYILYEGLLEISFKAITDTNIRKRLVNGDVRATEDMELSYMVLSKDNRLLDSQSSAVMEVIPQRE